MNMKIYHLSKAKVYHKLQKSTDILRENLAHKTNFNMMFYKNKWEPELAKRLGCTPPVWDL